MAFIRIGYRPVLTKLKILLPALVFASVSQSALADPVSVGARLDVDAAYYQSDVTLFNSNLKLRRLRLDISGKLNSRISYYVLAEFKNGGYGAQASWLRYRANRENEFYAGRIEIPFSLQRVTNSRYNLFMERSLPAALTTHYGTGVVYLHKGKQWSFRGGLFGQDRLSFNGSQMLGSAAAARLGRRFRFGDSRLWLGAAVMYQNAVGIERVRTRPESSVTNQRLVDSKLLTGLENITRVGLEGVWKKDQWSLQGEWINYSGQRTAANNLNFSGGYIEASRIFNGRRRFNFRSGEWMSPEVSEMNTWELAFRVSQIDLRDKTVNGGRETNYSLGLNYYFNATNRLMLNWIKVDASPNRHGINESPSILQARLQIGF